MSLVTRGLGVCSGLVVTRGLGQYTCGPYTVTGDFDRLIGTCDPKDLDLSTIDSGDTGCLDSVDQGSFIRGICRGNLRTLR